jgi:ARC6-like, IMS domain
LHGNIPQNTSSNSVSSSQMVLEIKIKEKQRIALIIGVVAAGVVAALSFISIISVKDLENSQSVDLASNSNDPSPLEQVSSPKESQDEKLKIQNNSENISSSTESTSIQSESNSQQKEEAQLTEGQAKSLLEDWLAAKSRIFAPPFDNDLINKFTTGKLNSDITAPSKGISYLQNVNGYFSFGNQEVQAIQKLNTTTDSAIVDAIILEDRTLYINGKRDQNWSNSQRSVTRFYLVKEDNLWKIRDYEDIN